MVCTKLISLPLLIQLSGIISVATFPSLDERRLVENTAVGIYSLGKEYIVQFSFLPLEHLKPDVQSDVIQFHEIDHNVGFDGPSVFWCSGDILFFESWISGNQTYFSTSTQYPLNKYIDIEIRQRKIDGKYIHTTTVNGKIERSIENKKPEVRSKRTVWASYNSPPDGFIKNFSVWAREESQMS